MLRKISVELVAAIQSSTTIDWSLKESVRATMRCKVRPLLAKGDDPLDRDEKAMGLGLQQFGLMAGHKRSN